MPPRRSLGAACLALCLAACATAPPRAGPPPTPAPRPPAPAVRPMLPPPPSAPPAANPFLALPGWAQDDHAAGLAAFQAACAGVRNPDLKEVCARALALGPADERAARAFLERWFRPVPVAAEGLLTGYFSPIYPARTQPDAEFSAPLRPRPADLPAPGAGPYPDRAAIEARPAADALVWMRPEDLFFLQTQGSGTLVLADGARLSAVADGSNGATFVGIGRPMREQGLLADGDSSADAIRAWLAAHRGPDAEALMDLNPRYVFFRLHPYDDAEPAGAAGLRLIPGRSVAVDLSRHAAGDLLWLDADAPVLSGAFPAYRRLVVALDTGGAIKGEARADLYLGRGPAAGLEAGRVRHRLFLYRLVPVSSPPA